MKRGLIACAVLFLFVFSGCQSASTHKEAKPDIVSGLLRAVNDGLVEVSGVWDVGAYSLEYIGDKTEETTEYLGQVYESI